MIDFAQPVQEILQNNYLKTNFENSEIREIEILRNCPHFLKFHKGNFTKKIPCFFIFKRTYLENR